MASTLFFKTNQLNQSLTCVFHPLCVGWNNSKKTWEYSIKDKRKLFPHLFLTLFVTSSMCYAVGGLVVLALIYDPTLFSTNQILLQVLLLGSYPLVVVVEMLLLFYGREIVAVINWGITLVTRLRLTEPIMKNTNFFAAFHKEISKITSPNRQIDWCAIIASCYASFQFVLSVSLPVGTAYGDNDHIYVILRGISSEKLLNGPHLNHLLFFKIFRYLGLIYVYQCNIFTFSVWINIIMSFLQVLVKTVFYLNRMQVSYDHIKMYRQVRICIYLNYTLFKVLLGTFLSLSFFIIIFSLNLSIFGWSFLPLKVYIMAPIMTLLFLMFLIFSLNIGSFLFEITSKTLNKWKREVNKGYRANFLKRVLKSMRPIALPVGDVGIIDRDIKVNYIDTLMVGIVNVLIVCQNFF